jgi:DNA-directed RNA polymerase, mitochondrial
VERPADFEIASRSTVEEGPAALLAEQRRLEEQFVPEGVRRMQRAERALARRKGVQVAPGREFLGGCLGQLEQAIAAQSAQELGAPKPSRFAFPMLSLSADKLAFIGLHTLCEAMRADALSEGRWPPARRLAQEIARKCRIERALDVRLSRAIDLVPILMSRNRSRSNALRRAQANAVLVDEPDPDSDSWLHLGAEVVALAVAHCTFGAEPAFERKVVYEGSGDARRSYVAFRLTDAGAVWLADVQQRVSTLATPAFQPMLVPPRRWAGLEDGGYFNGFGLRLVKLREDERVDEALRQAEISDVLAGVNALQETAWQVNRDVYRVMRACWRQTLLREDDFPRAPLLKLQRVAIPLKQHGDGADAKAASAARAKAYRHNMRAIGLAARVRSVLSTARRLVRRERFYFPYQLDRRGRAYPVPQVVHPQADDAGRSLLQFAEGMPLSESGQRWLTIHLASQYGHDKLPFSLRMQWVRENEDEILAAAADPLARKAFWAAADRPWGFLAACFEYRSMKLLGPSHVSHLPVSVDGTCNGLQHLSALAKNESVGAATNVVDALFPQDIYQLVAQAAANQISRDVAEGSAVAKVWEGIDRRHAKHATMATPYGVTINGIRREIVAKLEDKIEPFDTFGSDDPTHQWKCADYLARVLHKSIGVIVTPHRDVEALLHALVRLFAKRDVVLSWKVPSGFQVIHDYRVAREARVKTAIGNLVVQKVADQPKIDLRRQRSAIVANFIHSLDAAHMTLTVAAMAREGVRSFSMVHDSFGVHASDMECMNRVLREEFARMYEHDYFNGFLADQRNRLGMPAATKLQDLQLGKLDVGLVRTSTYFFS